MKQILFGIVLELFAVANVLLCSFLGQGGHYTPLCLGIGITAALIGIFAALIGVLKE